MKLELNWTKCLADKQHLV